MDTIEQVCLVIIGAIIYSSLYGILRWKILPGKLNVEKISSTYTNGISHCNNTIHTHRTNLPGYTAAIISEKTVSVLVGVISGISGLFILWETRYNVLRAKSTLILPSACLIYWYFFQDLYSMFETFRLSRECNMTTSTKQALLLFSKQKFIMTFHHVVLLALTIPFAQGRLRNGFGDFYVGCLFTMELSTPFIAMHFIFDHCGFKDTLIQQINGIVFAVVFFIVRIASFPLMFLIYVFQHHNGHIINAMYDIYWFCYAPFGLAFAMQLFWFLAVVKKVSRGAKRLYGKEHKQ